MKKALLISAFVLTFVAGMVLSDLIQQGFNKVFGDVFETRARLEEKLTEQQEKAAKEQEEAQQNYERLEDKMTRRDADMNSLIKEMDSKLNPSVIKDLLLTTPSDETGDKGRIFLDPPVGEAILEPTTSGDPTVEAFKKAFNNKAKSILDVSKGVLKEKVGQLNNELVRINDELKDRNIEVIGKLNEVEKLKGEVDRVNDQLQQKNTQLTSKLQEVETLKGDVDRINDELKQKNQQLTAKLDEVEQYKKELEQQKRYINDLEGIKSNLEKTVGVLETKIEDGRLKVSFKGDILFESGKHLLREEGKKLLASVFEILKKSTQQNDIFIAGHTDNVPIREDARDRYESNWTLSTYRAIEVVKYLTEQGISPKSVTAAGYGEYKPVADNTTAEGKAKNRRVELFLIPKIIKREK